MIKKELANYPKLADLKSAIQNDFSDKISLKDKIIVKGISNLDPFNPKYISKMMQFLAMMYVDHLQETRNLDITNQAKNGPETKSLVEEKDCMQVGLEAWQQGYMPVIHDAANKYKVGGGFLRVVGSQEEAIFYSSNLWKAHIENENLFKDGTGLKRLMTFYREFIIAFDQENSDVTKEDSAEKIELLLRAFVKENSGNDLKLGDKNFTDPAYWDAANVRQHKNLFTELSLIAVMAHEISAYQVRDAAPKQGEKRGYLPLEFTPNVTMGAFNPGSNLPQIYKAHITPSVAVDRRWWYPGNEETGLSSSEIEKRNQQAVEMPFEQTIEYYNEKIGKTETRKPFLILNALGTGAFRNKVTIMSGYFKNALTKFSGKIENLGGKVSFAILGPAYAQFKTLEVLTSQKDSVSAPNYGFRIFIGIGIASLILLAVGLLFIFPPAGLVALAGGAASLMAPVGIGLLVAGGLGLTGIAAKAGYEFVRTRLEYRAEERSLLDGSNKPYDNAHTVTERLATPPTITVSTPSVGNDQALEKPEKKAPFYEVVKSRVGVEEAEKYNENYKKTGKYGFGLSEVNLEFVYKAITLSELEKKELQNFVDSFPEGVVKKFNFYINETGYTGIDYAALEFNLQGEAREPTTFLGQIKAKFDEIVARRPKELPAPTTTTLAIPSVGNNKVGVNLQNPEEGRGQE